MNLDVGNYQKLTKIVVFLLTISAGLGIVVWYLPVVQKNEGMRREVLRIESDRIQEEEKGRRLRTEIDAMTTDSKTVERVARERMNYAKTNETVIRFEESPTPPAREPR